MRLCMYIKKPYILQRSLFHFPFPLPKVVQEPQHPLPQPSNISSPSSPFPTSPPQAAHLTLPSPPPPPPPPPPAYSPLFLLLLTGVFPPSASPPPPPPPLLYSPLFLLLLTGVLIRIPPGNPTTAGGGPLTFHSAIPVPSPSPSLKILGVGVGIGEVVVVMGDHATPL